MAKIMTGKQALQIIAHNDGEVPSSAQVESAIRGLDQVRDLESLLAACRGTIQDMLDPQHSLEVKKAIADAMFKRLDGEE